MKNKIILVVVLVWVVFSVAYIINDLWSNYKTKQLTAAYQQGQTDTINALIQAAEESCDPIPIFSGEKQIQLINTTCLEDNK